jgi:hypothetical protein
MLLDIIDGFRKPWRKFAVSPHLGTLSDVGAVVHWVSFGGVVSVGASLLRDR